MIEITPTLAIDDDEIQLEFIRASGPGGQNVNKVATAVQLRFDVVNSPSLPDDVKTRLMHLAGRRLTGEGVLVLTADRYRTQPRNRVDAVAQLTELIRKATIRPKPRRKTKPTLAAKQRRLAQKQRRGEIKQGRQSKPTTDE